MTLQAKITELKNQYPVIKIGSDEAGYTDLDAAEYEATLSAWADDLLAKEAEAAQEAKATADKAALLKRLGISADEAKLLLS